MSRLIRRILILSVAAQLIGCAPIPHNEELPVADVYVDGTSIVYRGTISRESNSRLFELVAALDFAPGSLVISSKGGETFAGMDLGLWVHRNGLNVIVEAYCLSSCANYVFPAGRSKILNPEAALAWHGGSMQDDWGEPCSELPRTAMEQGLDCADVEKILGTRLQEFRKAEQAFFVEIGVDQRVTILGQVPQYECRGDNAFMGWDYSIEDMERLGINNIEVRNGPWRPVSPSPDFSICRVQLGSDFR